ncbi:MAG TPA: N-acetylmuramoyl-L-alanine amidase [Gemmatimonadaceae bacterium]|nr:N-acetylmuramoyl-L-alanine amidase [Gemmatimonadaceae bacterium]
MLSFLLLLQVAMPTDTLTAISVRVGDQRTRVAIQRVQGQAMVSADVLATRLGGVVRRGAPDRFTFALPDLQMELIAGTPVVLSGTTVAPLPLAPRVQAAELFVPLAFVSEVLPRLGRTAGFSYDTTLAELSKPASQAITASRTSSPPPPPVRSAAPAPTPPKAARPVIVIDPGHGGPDRGMKGPLRSRNKIHEADITLQIGKKLRDVLRQSGVDVIMTRTTDTLIALADRGRVANDEKADLFLSLHVNAANLRWRNPGTARGFETYFLSEARTDDARRVEEMENSSIQFEVDSLPADDGLSFILNDMKQNESLRESQLLADAIQSGMGTVHPGPSRGVKQAGFRVLVAALVPAVLVEVGFGTNAAEARYLASAQGQTALARAIAKATLGYLTGYSRRRTQGDTTH